jgi:polygalacturonase
MFDLERPISLQLTSVQSAFLRLLILVLCMIALCPSSVRAAVRDVTQPPYNAKGDGTTDDTVAINSAVAALQPGDTLYFPCTSGGSTYRITSQLTIRQTGGVPLSNVIVQGVSAAPNNEFQVAIYADNNGAPGALIASSSSQTIVPDAWSVVPISASVATNSFYWLAYNTNGLDGNANNLRVDPGGATSEWITSEPFGTWPTTYGPVGGSSNYNASIYASFQ